MVDHLAEAERRNGFLYRLTSKIRQDRGSRYLRRDNVKVASSLDSRGHTSCGDHAAAREPDLDGWAFDLLERPHTPRWLARCHLHAAFVPRLKNAIYRAQDNRGPAHAVQET